MASAVHSRRGRAWLPLMAAAALTASAAGTCYIVNDPVSCCSDYWTACTDGKDPPQKWPCLQDSNAAGWNIQTYTIVQYDQSGMDTIIPSVVGSCKMIYTSCGSNYGDCVQAQPVPVFCTSTQLGGLYCVKP